MAVVIRLSRGGTPGNPQYRIVAADKLRCRDGRFLEVLGTFSPTSNPAKVVLNEERVKFWVNNGAVPSLVVKNLFKKGIPNFIEPREKNKLDKVRAARKARAAKKKK